MKKSCLAPSATRRVLQEQFSHLSLLHLPPPSWCQAASAGGVSRPDCGSSAASKESAAALLLVLGTRAPSCDGHWQDWLLVWRQAIYNYTLMIEISTPKKGKLKYSMKTKHNRILSSQMFSYEELNCVMSYVVSQAFKFSLHVSFKIRPESAQNETCP